MQYVSQTEVFFWMSVASWRSACFCVVLCVVFVRAILSWCPWTWHVYIVYNSLSLNIPSIYVNMVFLSRKLVPSKKQVQRCKDVHEEGRLWIVTYKSLWRNFYINGKGVFLKVCMYFWQQCYVSFRIWVYVCCKLCTVNASDTSCMLLSLSSHSNLSFICNLYIQKTNIIPCKYHNFM